MSDNEVREHEEREEMRTATMYRARIRSGPDGILVADLSRALPGTWEHLEAAGFTKGADGIYTKQPATAQPPVLEPLASSEARRTTSKSRNS